MARRLDRPLKEIVRDARAVLRLTQAKFGEALGWSHRTAVRWERGRSSPYPPALCKLAALLVTDAPELAAEVAAAAGESLESLGLAQKPVSRVTDGDLVDAVVCATADSCDLPPRALRPLLYAAFARARALGLTVEKVEESLRMRAETKAQKGKAAEPLRVRVARAEEEEEERETVAGPTGAGKKARVR